MRARVDKENSATNADIWSFERPLLLGDFTTLSKNGHFAAACIARGDLVSFLSSCHASVNSFQAALAGAAIGDMFARYQAGVALLHLFVRSNWAGPSISTASKLGLSPEALDCDPELLSRGGEDVSRSVRFPNALLAARLLLVDGASSLANSGAQLVYWWSARVSLAHHALLSAPTPQLQVEIFLSFARFLGEGAARTADLFRPVRFLPDDAVEEYGDNEISLFPDIAQAESEDEEAVNCVLKGDRSDRALAVLAYVELALAQKSFYDARGATESIQMATRISALHLQVTGKLGVRTKFQAKPTAQLVASAYQLVQHPDDTRISREKFTGLSTVFPLRKANCENKTEERMTLAEKLPLPTNCAINDSDVLGYIKLTDQENSEQPKTTVIASASGEENGYELDKDIEKEDREVGPLVQNLTPLDQAIVLAHSAIVRAQNALHLLTDEQMAPYVNLVLSSETSHAGTSSLAQIKALLLRVSFESDRGRYLERCMSQMEELENFVDNDMSNADDDEINAASAERLQFSFATSIPPRWELKKQLAISLGKIGLVKSAMEIFKELEFWDELVDCHRLIGNLGAAETLVREQLASLDAAVNEARTAVDSNRDIAQSIAKSRLRRAESARKSRRPRMLCVLGDVTRDMGHFQKAWRESGGRYTRAKRALGRGCVERGWWGEAVGHFRDALEINPLFPETWFTYGCAAIEIGNMQLAAEAFTHVIQQTPDNGEAWNNLGRVLSELGKRKEALKALSEAARLKRDSWRIWNNVLMLASETRSAIDILRAVERLLELRGRNAEIERPLQVAVDEVVRLAKSDNANERNEAVSLCKKLLKVLGRATSIVSTNATVWAAYAELHELAPGAGGPKKALECRQKQIRALIAQGHWTNDHASFRHMAVASIALCRNALKVGDCISLRAAELHMDSILTQTSEELEEDEGFLEMQRISMAVSEAARRLAEECNPQSSTSAPNYT